MLLATVRLNDKPTLQLGMEIPSFSCLMGRVEGTDLKVNGYIAPEQLLHSLSATADPEVLARIIEVLKEGLSYYDGEGNLLNSDDPKVKDQVKTLGLPGKNGKILTLPHAEVSLGSTANDGMPNFERTLHGELVVTDYLVNWAFQRVGKELADKTDGILFSEDSKKLQSCSMGSINVSLTAFVEFQGHHYLLGHKKSGDIMVQPGQVHGSMLPGGIFGGHMADIEAHTSEDGSLPIEALSEALTHHAASKWGVTKDEFRNGIVMDTQNPLLISELVELGYFQVGYVVKALEPKMLEEMLLKENSKDPSLKMTELVLIPVGAGHNTETMWSVTADKDESGTHLVMTPHEVLDSSSFVGYARAIRDAAARHRWFNQVIENNALSLDQGIPVKVMAA